MITTMVEGFDVEISQEGAGRLSGKVSELPGCEAHGKDMRELRINMERAIVAYIKRVAGRKPEFGKTERGASGQSGQDKTERGKR